ncbi:hypothetical protein [Streptomyces sp. RTd22]|uniref:hypothetical protein n=1 Tax=Streptomyces sp. RTd22 TaxID=1841249 RepID=UPI0007C4B8F2|nr:hypothetical protein [Streptomyces sp. RTd22]
MTSQALLTMILAAVCLSGPTVAAEIMWRRHHVRARAARLVSAVKKTSALLRRRLAAVEIWAQDHHITLAITVLALLGTMLVFVLTYRLEQTVALAKMYAPVVTIVVAVVGTVIRSVKWLRGRRKARLSSTTDPH